MNNTVAMQKTGTKTSAFGTNGRINHDSTAFYDSKLYKELSVVKEVPKTENIYPRHLLNKLIIASSENMMDIPDNSLHLMITSPPYNASKEYDKDLSLSEYLNMLKQVFSETYRVLVNGGRACVNIANLGRKPYIPLSDYISKMMIEIGFNMRGEIIWLHHVGQPLRRHFYGRAGGVGVRDRIKGTSQKISLRNAVILKELREIAVLKNHRLLVKTGLIDEPLCLVVHVAQHIRHIDIP